MPRLPSYDSISSIRYTLQRLEENYPAPEDQSVIAELKRILLLRIAELESASATADTQKAKPKPKVAVSHNGDESDTASPV